MKNNRPKPLTAYCILSWVWMAYMLFGIVIALVSGPMTDEQIREQKLALLENLSEEELAISGDVIEETVAILEVTRDNLYTINTLNLLQVLLGAFAVYLMFNLRKLGFHLYIVYSILPLAVSTYFFGGYSIGILGVIVTAVISGLFVLLYGLQVKHMQN